MSARGWAGPFIVVAGGVMLAGSVAAPWVRHLSTRDVGGVPIVEEVTSAGTRFAGDVLLPALGVVVVGMLALVLPAARRPLSVALWLGAFYAGGQVLWGVTVARDTGGSLTSAPFVAFLACLLLSLGAMAMRSRAVPAEPALSERYTVEGSAGGPEDEEWRLAAEDGDRAE